MAKEGEDTSRAGHRRVEVEILRSLISSSSFVGSLEVSLSKECIYCEAKYKQREKDKEREKKKKLENRKIT